MKTQKMVIIITLAASCLVISILTIIIGSISISSMRKVDESLYYILERQFIPATEIGRANEMLQRQRVSIRDMIIGAAADDLDMIERARDLAEIYHEIMQESLNNYSITITFPYEMELFHETRQLYENEFRVGLMLVYESAKNGEDINELYPLMREYTAIVNQITENLDACLEMKKFLADELVYNSYNTNDTFLVLLIMIIVIMLITNVGVALFLALYTAFSISNQLRKD